MPIGKKKTALTDANRKKENSFNRCQSEKTNFRKLVSNETRRSKDVDVRTTLLTVF
jgi:hypothetical protein